jgi:phosphatidylglycerophosphatase A
MKQSLKDVYTNPSLFIATGFGVGLIPWAPGTWHLGQPCGCFHLSWYS